MLKFLLVFSIFLTSCGGDKTKATTTSNLHLEIALGHIKKDNLPLALKELLVAQDIDKKNAVVQSYLGFVYFVRERYDLAEEHYKRAIDIDPKFSDAKNNLARVYIETNQLLLADKLLDQVLVDYTYQDFARAYLNKGMIEFHRKNYAKSLEFLRKTISSDRDNCLAHVYIGRCYLGQNDLKLATEQLTRAISFCRSFNNDEAHYYNAIALYRAGEKELAVVRFEELIKVFPSGKNKENARKMIELINKGGL